GLFLFLLSLRARRFGWLPGNRVFTISVGMRSRRIPPSVCAQCLRVLRVTPKTLRLPAVSSRLPDSRTRDLPFAFTGAPPFVSKGGSDLVAQVSRRLRTRDLGLFADFAHRGPKVK